MSDSLEKRFKAFLIVLYCLINQLLCDGKIILEKTPSTGQQNQRLKSVKKTEKAGTNPNAYIIASEPILANPILRQDKPLKQLLG